MSAHWNSICSAWLKRTLQVCSPANRTQRCTGRARSSYVLELACNPTNEYEPAQQERQNCYDHYVTVSRSRRLKGSKKQWACQAATEQQHSTFLELLDMCKWWKGQAEQVREVDLRLLTFCMHRVWQSQRQNWPEMVKFPQKLASKNKTDLCCKGRHPIDWERKQLVALLRPHRCFSALAWQSGALLHLSLPPCCWLLRLIKQELDFASKCQNNNVHGQTVMMMMMMTIPVPWEYC